MTDWSWINSDLSRQIIDQEISKINTLLPNRYFGTVLQLGVPQGRSYFKSVPGMSRIFVTDNCEPHLQTIQDIQPLVHSDMNQLPLGRRAAELIIMPHTLDQACNPINVLREVSQIIDDDGVLVLSGFNPVSFFGLSKKSNQTILRKKNIPPSYTPRRVKEWLMLIGFEVTAGCYMDYLPPVYHPATRKMLGFLDPAGARWWPVFAGVYIIVAKKQNWVAQKVSMLDTLKKRLNTNLSQPATRYDS